MNFAFFRRSALAAVAGALSLVATVARAEEPALPVSAAEIWAVADDAFDAGRYAEALAGYEILARTADLRAMRRAGELLLYGQGLLPPELPLRLQRAAAWLTLAAARGDTDAAALWPQAVGPHVSGDPETPSLPALIARARH
jgi:TPR repeat protein